LVEDFVRLAAAEFLPPLLAAAFEGARLVLLLADDFVLDADFALPLLFGAALAFDPPLLAFAFDPEALDPEDFALLLDFRAPPRFGFSGTVMTASCPIWFMSGVMPGISVFV